MSHIIEEILSHLKRHDHLEYGESATQLNHAPQAAAFAINEGATGALVTAALLHEFGHLLHNEGTAERSHEETAAGLDILPRDRYTPYLKANVQ